MGVRRENATILDRTRLLFAAAAAALLLGSANWWIDSLETPPLSGLEPERVARATRPRTPAKADLRTPGSARPRPAPVETAARPETAPEVLAATPAPVETDSTAQPAPEVLADAVPATPAPVKTDSAPQPAPEDLAHAVPATPAPVETDSAPQPAPEDLADAVPATPAPVETDSAVQPAPEVLADALPATPTPLETHSAAQPAPEVLADALPATPTPVETHSAAQPAPEVLVDAGPAARSGPLSIRGRVTAAGLRPVAEARVNLLVRGADGGTRALSSAPCAADGTFSIEVLHAEPSATFQLCALAPGFEPTLRSSARPDGGRPWNLDLALCPGEPFAGRLVDAAGQGIVGATITLLTPDLRVGRKGLWAVHATPSFAGGRFSLPREASGEVYLHAAKEGVGTAWLGPDDLQAQGHELGDLVLRGGPALGGVVLRPDGSPLANLALEITPLARVGQGRTTDEWLDERFTIERGDGLLAAATRTDGTGRFTVKGLRPGPYTVQARPGGPTLAGDGTKCAPGDDQLVLVCNARSLRLSVVDETGTPLTGARVLATAWGADGAATATTVEAAGSAGGVALDLPAACERLGLFVSGAGRQPWSQEIAVARDAHGLEQRAVLGPPLDPGRMDLRVIVPEDGPAPLYRVAVRPAAVSRTLLQFTLDGAVETRSPDLAPGVYRLDLIPRSGPGRTGYHRPLSDVGPVVVEAGETVRVDLEAALAGRIELTLTATEHPDGSAQGLGPDRSASQREEAFGLLAATHGARVELARDDADDDPAWRPLPLTVRGANWRTQRDWLLPGLERGTSLLLDPGPVRLRISTPGYAHFETELVIEAGRSAALAPTLTAN